jgi:hypothetical protein
MDHELDEAITKFDRIADRRIQEAIRAGEFDNLPGMGKPLQDIEDNPFIPDDMRAAFKVLSNSGYAPDWMVLAQQIDAEVEKMRHTADLHFAYLRRRLQEVGSDPYAVKRLRQIVDHLKAEHRRAAAIHAQYLDEINRKITTFNHMVPIASLMKIPLSHTAEMDKFEDRLPAFLNY